MKKKLAAGVLPYCINTGRVLIGRRSQFCTHPWTWAGFGGLQEPEDKTLLHTALREFQEETGFHGDISLVPGQNVTRGDVQGHVFLGALTMEFRPKLNWEHDVASWVDPDEIDPRVLHWTLQQFFALQ